MNMFMMPAVAGANIGTRTSVRKNGSSLASGAPAMPARPSGYHQPKTVARETTGVQCPGLQSKKTLVH